MSDSFAEFEKHCLSWQTRLGLQDWRFIMQHEDGEGPDGQFADVSYDRRTRTARFMFYSKTETAQPIERRARHEVLHVLLADVLGEAAACRSDEHPDVVREEHRLIERLLKVTDQ